jgi:translation elongation factor EF-G
MKLAEEDPSFRFAPMKDGPNHYCRMGELQLESLLTDAP